MRRRGLGEGSVWVSGLLVGAATFALVVAHLSEDWSLAAAALAAAATALLASALRGRRQGAAGAFGTDRGGEGRSSSRRALP